MKHNATLAVWLLFVTGAPMRFYGQDSRGTPASTFKQPIEMKHLRGVIADPMWAVMVKQQVTLQAQHGKDFSDIKSVQTDEEGRFDFGEIRRGTYRIFTTRRNFCQVLIPVRLAKRGWAGLRVAVPVAASDTYAGYCSDNTRIEQLAK